jgi:DNA-binding MarR family transcriptional regulator
LTTERCGYILITVKKANACYCVSLRRATQTVTQLYDTVLAPSGLKLTQYSLLCAIAQHGPASITTLATAVDLDRSTLGRNLQVLERAGLASFVAGVDLRERLVQLTDQGKMARAAAAPLWKQAQARVREVLGNEQLEALTTSLAQLVAGVS